MDFFLKKRRWSERHLQRKLIIHFWINATFYACRCRSTGHTFHQLRFPIIPSSIKIFHILYTINFRTDSLTFIERSTNIQYHQTRLYFFFFLIFFVQNFYLNWRKKKNFKKNYDESKLQMNTRNEAKKKNSRKTNQVNEHRWAHCELNREQH